MIREIIPETELLPLMATVRKKFAAENVQLGYSFDPDEQLCGTAFYFYLLFYHWPEVVKLSFPDISDISLLYNTYYWHRLYVNLWIIQHGNDAGLEQQSFSIIESMGQTDVEADWKLVEQLDRDATHKSNALAAELKERKGRPSE